MFDVIRYYRYGLFLLCFLLIAYGILQICNRRSGASLSSAAVKEHVFKGRKLLNLLIFMLLILNGFMVPLQMQQSATAEIALNYVQASQGLNPNGTRYNQADILSTEVLQKAIKKGALKGITTGDLQRVLSVAPKIQGNSNDKGSYFISTQFVLSYEANSKTANVDGEQLLSLVAESYKEWFMEKYSDNVSALQLDFSDMKEEDYLDICTYLQNKGNLIEAYMTAMAEKEPAFRSKTNGETFQSIAARASNVANLMVENLDAYVLENSISKDAPLYMGRLSFQNIFDYFDAAKADASNKNNIKAISMYEDGLARIVLVPTYDTNYQFYMSQTRIGIDDFAEKADEYAGEKTQIRSGIAHNNRILRQLSTAASISGEDKKAEELIAQIQSELIKLAGEAQTLVKEFSASQSNEYMLLNVRRLENRVGEVAVTVLLYTLLFAFAVYCVSFATTSAKQSRGDVRQSVPGHRSGGGKRVSSHAATPNASARGEKR